MRSFPRIFRSAMCFSWTQSWPPETQPPVLSRFALAFAIAALFATFATGKVRSVFMAAVCCCLLTS